MTYFRTLLRASGYEPEDALQELVIIFAQRLQGQHPFDPSRAQLRSYLFLLTRSVLKNRTDKRCRRSRGLGVLAAHHRGRTAELDIESLFPDQTLFAE